MFSRLECNDWYNITFTNILKWYETVLNSKVSKNIRNQGNTLFCWAFAISTMLRQSLNLFLSELVLEDVMEKEAFEKLFSDDFHRQLRNELIMIPIPKHLSNEYVDESPLSQGHYLDLAFEKVTPGKTDFIGN